MSQLYEYIKMAFFNILSNKVRSLLTMLGIIIGISSVILIMSLGNGAKNMITGQLNNIGGGQVAIMSMNSENLISLDDLEYLKENVDGIRQDRQSYFTCTPASFLTHTHQLLFYMFL